MICVPFKPEDYKNIAEAVALAAAALFFLFKLVSGYLVSNLTLSLSSRRAKNPQDPSRELLAVDLVMSKGDKESAVLKKLIITVTPAGYASEAKELKAPLVQSVGRMIRLAAGESTQFSEVWDIPADSVCSIEVTVDARVGFLPSVMPMRDTGKHLPLAYLTPNNRINSDLRRDAAQSGYAERYA